MANKEDTFVMQDALEEYHAKNMEKQAAELAEAKAYTDDAIDTLDVSDTAVDGQYVSAVSEADGKITVTRANLPTLSDLGGQAAGDYATKSEAQGYASDALDEAKDYTDDLEEKLEEEITAIPKFDIEVVESLDKVTSPSTTTVYLVTGGNVNDNDNMYTEYIYVEHTVDGVTTYTWEKLGEQNFDLADYYTAGDVDKLLEGKASASEFETFKQAVTDNADAISDIEDTISDYGTVKSNASSALTQTGENATAIEKLQEGKEDAGTAQSLIDALDYDDSGYASTKYVSKVTQEDGQITVEHESLPDLSGYASQTDLDALDEKLYGDEGDIAELQEGKQDKGDYIEVESTAASSETEIINHKNELISLEQTLAKRTGFKLHNENRDLDGGVDGIFGYGTGGERLGLYNSTKGEWGLSVDADNNIFLGASNIGSNKQPLYVNSSGQVEAGNYIPSLNGSQQTSEASFYAPTGAGTAGQVLKSNGSGKAPDWADNTVEEANVANQVANALTVEDVGTFDGSEKLTIPLATESQSGLMSAEDKGQLNDMYNAVFGRDTLENTPWTEIANSAAIGTAKAKWNIGDTKTITLSTGEEITVRIIGFNHDASNSITFEMVDLLSTTYAHHGTDTNTGGWEDSDIRSTLNNTIFSQLPNDLQGVVRTVIKKASAGNQSDTITDSQDKLFLLSLAEICSESALTNSAWSSVSSYASVYNAEGSQYEYYKDLLGDFDPCDSTSLLQKQRNGSKDSWWLRSPVRVSSAYFLYFYDYAFINTANANNSYGVAFCFCV